MIDRRIFFEEWRQRFGALSQGQVDTITLFLDYWAGRGLGDLRWLAYAFATAHGEVGAALQPVREGFAKTDLGARQAVMKLYKAGKISVDYAMPDPKTGKSYFGRGFVQLTHKSNYEAMGHLLGLDLVGNPGLALEPGIAVKILFVGMERGTFTGGRHRFDIYFSGGHTDWMGARRIINGTDKAEKFATLGKEYLSILLAATAARPVPDVAAPPAAPVPVDMPDALPPRPPDDEPPKHGSPMAIILAALIGLAVLVWQFIVHIWETLP